MAVFAETVLQLFDAGFEGLDRGVHLRKQHVKSFGTLLIYYLELFAC